MNVFKNLIVTLCLLYLAVVIECIATLVLLVMDRGALVNRWKTGDTAFHAAFEKRDVPMAGNHVHDDVPLSEYVG